jgi:hypothetical protein
MAKSSKHGPSKNTGASGRNSGGGGINTKQHVRVGVRVGPASTQKVSPEAVSAIGNQRGNHTMAGTAPMSKAMPPALIRGNAVQVPLGNDLARNVGRGGPGVGYVKHGQSGSQGFHGSPNPGAHGGDPNLPGGGASGPAGFGFGGKR